MRDCLEQAATKMDLDQLGEFVAIYWEIWNARNRYVFGRPNSNLEVLSSHVVKFVMNYRELREKTENPKVQHQALRRPPGAGMMKLNFDGGNVNMDGRGWGCAVRNPDGEILVTGVPQGEQFSSSLVEEAKACLKGLQVAKEYGYYSLVVEGDCLALIQRLQHQVIDDSILGFIVSDIL